MIVSDASSDGPSSMPSVAVTVHVHSSYGVVSSAESVGVSMPASVSVSASASLHHVWLDH